MAKISLLNGSYVCIFRKNYKKQLTCLAEIFQKNSGVHPFWTTKGIKNFGRAESRTNWRETKNIQIKLATTCGKNEQQRDGKNSAEL